MVENQIAFLGLGVMGAPMTINFAQHNLPIKAWNRTGDRPWLQNVTASGATIVNSIQEAVESASIIFTCLGDIPDVEEVIFGNGGIIHHASPHSIIVDFSTIGSQGARAIALKLKTHQIRFMDAPVSGGDIGAKNGTLTIMVGGEKADFEEIKPYLDIVGKNITYCGEVGSGQAVKLCNQVLASLHMVALCEALQLAKTQNIDPNLIVDVCSTGAAGSWALTNLAPKIINQDYQPGFMIKHILKDLRLVKEVIEDIENYPGINLAQQLFQQVAHQNNDNGYLEGTQAMIKAYGEKF
ncbi:6-phosphogluconate dehydrogenase NAD-binding protein [Cyanobacterium stanieri PCC 7202]|uniref:6-phosphogluconate dehydrogenase NAD-binding protein n=1 Tax=Cyanobacterium stanieri (strain ATCC 29140 / PCC 7202) TaxID=292563 RepID=K9YLI0_CYASC|nr:6-phosphogluconate dehydrogenase NAD-binding protein [Cyanobacterium stanieri PCC 7202]